MSQYTCCPECGHVFHVASVPRGAVPPHGTPGRYRYHHCRCDVCVKNQRARWWEAEKRRAAGVNAKAARGGYEWTGPDLELAARDDISVQEIALMLGRTRKSVKRMREKIRKGDPRVTQLAGLPVEDRPALAGVVRHYIEEGNDHE